MVVSVGNLKIASEEEPTKQKAIAPSANRKSERFVNPHIGDK
ncbi:hypothetical protein [Dendronalium sp. ChiSLP03b]|nr:hypothetical protein [Dendronalium sp. ChiSLP03b]MDZ8205000.1 hypothetical protein [Dendronalium sp. ChiSLP03b]